MILGKLHNFLQSLSLFNDQVGIIVWEASWEPQAVRKAGPGTPLLNWKDQDKPVKGNSLFVQWLALYNFTAKGMGSGPDQGSKILQKYPKRKKKSPCEKFLLKHTTQRERKKDRKGGKERGMEERRDLKAPSLYMVACLIALMSDSSGPRGLWPARLLCLWDFPGKNTGMDCHSLLQRIFWSRDGTWVSYTAGGFFTV